MEYRRKTENITPTTNGTYLCIVTDNNNCIDTLQYYVNNLPSTSTNLEIHNLLIYPNPTNKLINIKFNMLNKKEVIVKIFNTLGKLYIKIFITHLLLNNEYNRIISLDGFPKGFFTS